MLTLPIKKKWFDMILSGEKKEEYREIKPYWTKRFENVFTFAPFDRYRIDDDPHEVIFRNGYGKNAPSFTAICKLNVSTGKEEWGAEYGKRYYVLKILEIKEVSL